MKNYLEDKPGGKKSISKSDYPNKDMSKCQLKLDYKLETPKPNYFTIVNSPSDLQ